MNRRSTALACFALTVAALVSAAEEPAREEGWFHAVRKGTAYGRLHRVAARHADRIEVQLDWRLLLDLFGGRQEVTIRAELVAEPDGRPRAFKYHARYAVKETRREGRLEEGGKALLVSEPGRPPVRLAVGPHTVFDDLVPVAVRARGARPGQTLPLELLDLDELSTVPARVEVQAAGPGQRLVVRPAGGAPEHHYVLDAEGRVREMATPALGVKIVAVAREAAERIAHLKMDDGYTLTVQSKRRFENPAEVLAARVQLAWKGVALEKFQLQDSRQRVASARRDPLFGRTTVELVLVRRPAPDASLTLAAAASAPSGAGYLGSCRYVKPGHPKIVAAAKAAVEGETRAAAAAARLARFVHQTVKTEMIAETLSGPEVLERKVGKCVEYATLYASLARAVGLPTRLALGLRWIGDRWAGHLWNEVWLGEWVPVDAGYDEVGTSGSQLVKLVHGATVEETQAVRWALVDNLAVEILEIETAPNPLAARHKDGIQGGAFTSLAFRCRLAAPSAEWRLERDPSGSILFAHAGEGRLHVYLSLFATPGGYDAPGLLALRHRLHFAPRVKEYRKLAEGETTLSGRKAHSLLVQGQMRSESSVLREVLLIEGQSAYLFSAYCQAAAWDKRAADVERLLAAFQRLE